jgi:hypothetical protein
MQAFALLLLVEAKVRLAGPSVWLTQETAKKAGMILPFSRKFQRYSAIMRNLKHEYTSANPINMESGGN